MFTMSSSSCSDSTLRPMEKNLKQISISSNHLLMLHGDRTLYGSPYSKKELFGTWVENSGSKLGLIRLFDNIAKIAKVLALNTGTILLCIDSKTKKNELY